MKPENWNKKTDKEKLEYAIELLKSTRGEFITSQALYIAIENMKKVKAPHTEVSNIEDMEILLEVLFPIYKVVADAEKKFREEK